MMHSSLFYYLFFYHHTSSSVIFTLSLHDALPIYSFFIYRKKLLTQPQESEIFAFVDESVTTNVLERWLNATNTTELRDQNTLRSEEHTSELQSRGHLVCRLLLEKKKITHK